MFRRHYWEMFVIETLLLVCAALLAMAALVHLYWAFGGRWGANAAIPQHMDGSRLFQPSPAGTVAVALALLVMAVFVAQYKSPWFSLPQWLLNIGMGILSAIFLIRALGWFKYVGFFKAIRTTRFGRYDTYFYCPFCLFLGTTFGYTSLQP